MAPFIFLFKLSGNTETSKTKQTREYWKLKCVFFELFNTMSNTLLNGELFSELKKLDQRYGKDSELPSQHKKARNSIKKKYKSNADVERLANSIRASEDEVKAKQNKIVEKNVQKLLKSARTKKNVEYDSIIQQLDSTKRQYEPKGRKLLSRPSKKSKLNQESTTAFTEEDFEKFSAEYFVNSKPIRKDWKVFEFSRLLVLPKFTQSTVNFYQNSPHFVNK